MGIPSCTKQPADNRLYDMDFAALLGAGETIAGVTSVTIDNTTTTPPVTVGATSYSGTVAQVRLSAGLTGTRYKVTIVVTTSLSNTLEGEGWLQVENN